MTILSRAKTAMLKLAGLFVTIDDTNIPETQVTFIKDHALKQRLYINPRDSEELVNNIRAKHSIDSICISSKNGSVILSSDKKAKDDALTGVAMFNYIKSESPKSEGFFIKENGHWQMVYPHNDNVYLVKAQDYLTNIELRIIAEEIEKFLLKREGDLIAKELEAQIS